MTSKAMRRATHTHVHFCGAGFPQVDHTRPGRGAAYDRIVHYYDPFSGNHFLDQIQLYAHVEIADELTRLQKCAANIVVADEGVGVRNLEFLSKTESGIISRVGYRHDDVRFDWKFSRQFAAHFH